MTTNCFVGVIIEVSKVQKLILKTVKVIIPIIINVCLLLLLGRHSTEATRPSHLIRTLNGCPLIFDLGNLGYRYRKPQICDKMLPTYVTNDSVPSFDPFLKFNWTFAPFGAMEDTYQVSLLIDEPLNTRFRIWDVVLRVRSFKEGKLGGGVGFFERKDDFIPFCCEKNKRRTMIRFVNNRKQRPDQLSVRWTPLTFTGSVVFVANIFNNETEYLVDVQSPPFKVPIEKSVKEGQEPETTTPFSDDWPVDSPNIPQF